MNTKYLSTKIELEHDKVHLVPFTDERRSELQEIIFDEDIWNYMGIFVRTESDFREYLINTLDAHKKGICYAFLIIDKASARVVGSTRFGHFNFASEKCEIGWTWYGKEFQGTGLNMACKYALLKFGFENVGFRRIQFSADQENIRSQKAIEKLGALKEGVFRNNYIDSQGNSKHDVYYSIIREDWDELKVQRFQNFVKSH